ncbi:MAG: hypothetical protein KatS3mg043_0859 [Rhodothermaceae bacterium]|nr:MAG: hypothetical protein KatS3mg043_0859 [Rhodothermaceae bacterium]
MSALPRVLKKGRTPASPSSAEEAGPVPRRIPAAQVLDRALPPPGATGPPPRIIRREAARRLAEPFEVPLLTAEPAFPLPQPEKPAADDLPASTEALEALRARWEAEQEEAFARRLAEAVERARAEGYDAGYWEAEQALRREFEASRAALREDVARLKACWQSFLEKVEPLLGHLAFTIAQTILDAPLPTELKDAGTRSLSAAIDRLAGEAPLAVRLHPVDLLRLRESGLLDEVAAAHPGLTWDSDESLQEGDWIVESPAAMIRHVKAELLETLRRRMGLDDPGDDRS